MRTPYPLKTQQMLIALTKEPQLFIKYDLSAVSSSHFQAGRPIGPPSAKRAKIPIGGVGDARAGQNSED